MPAINKRKKLFLAVLLVLLVILSLSSMGCGTIDAPTHPNQPKTMAEEEEVVVAPPRTLDRPDDNLQCMEIKTGWYIAITSSQGSVAIVENEKGNNIIQINASDGNGGYNYHSSLSIDSLDNNYIDVVIYFNQEVEYTSEDDWQIEVSFTSIYFTGRDNSPQVCTGNSFFLKAYKNNN